MEGRFQQAAGPSAWILVLCAFSSVTTAEEAETGRYPWTAEASAVAGQYLALGKHMPVEAERSVDMYGASFVAAEVLPVTAMAWTGNQRRNSGFEDQRRTYVRPPQLVIRGVPPPRYPRITNQEIPSPSDDPYLSGKPGTVLVNSGASEALNKQMTHLWRKWPGKAVARGIGTALTFAKYGPELANRFAYDIPLSREWKNGLRHDLVVKCGGLIGGALGGTGGAIGGSVAADQFQRWGAAEWHRNIRTPSGRAAFRRGNTLGAMTGGWADRARYKLHTWTYKATTRLFAFAEREVGVPGFWTEFDRDTRNLTMGRASNPAADSISPMRTERLRPIQPMRWDHLQPKTQRALNEYILPIQMETRRGIKEYLMPIQKNVRLQFQSYQQTYFQPQTLRLTMPSTPNLNLQSIQRASTPTLQRFNPRMMPSVGMRAIQRINVPSIPRQNLRPQRNYFPPP